MRKLNDPGLGLSCDKVEVDFSYFGLLWNRRVAYFRATGIRFDAAPYLTGVDTNLFDSTKIELDAVIDGGSGRDGMRFSVSGRVLDWPLFVTGNLRSRYSSDIVNAEGSVRVALKSGRHDQTPYEIVADFAGSPFEWSADARIADLRFDDADPVVGRVVARLPTPGVTNLTFGGRMSLDVHAQKTRAIPVVAWEAEAPLRDINVSLTAGKNDIAVHGLSVSASAFGIADHVDIRPIMARVKSIDAAAFTITNFYSTVRKEGVRFLISEAGAGFCGGDIRLYSLSLDPEKLNAGFTLFLDDIDTGEMLAHLPGFHGSATGRLHGKLPLRVINGREVRLKDAFLYSTPGESGKLMIADTSMVTANLAAGGVSEAACENISKALANLDYDVLKFKLVREDDGGVALTVKIEGAATSGGTTVPVSFEVTFHGELEQLVNLGLKSATNN